jgi:hypothetical protein
MSVKKRARRLSALKILEVSAVDRGAGEGVRIALMKRAGARPRFRFNDADSLVPIENDVDQAVAAAKREIAENIAVAQKPAGSNPTEKRQQMGERMEPQTDLATVAKKHIEAIAKAQGCGFDRALLTCSQSRDPADRAAWDIIKFSGSSAAPVEVEKASEKAVRKGLKRLEKRLEEIQAATGCSRAGAALRLSTSRSGEDPALWLLHKSQANGTTDGEHLNRPRLSPSEQALAELIRGLKAAYPGRKMSEGEWRKAALRTMAHQPFGMQPLVNYSL